MVTDLPGGLRRTSLGLHAVAFACAVFSAGCSEDSGKPSASESDDGGGAEGGEPSSAAGAGGHSAPPVPSGELARIGIVSAFGAEADILLAETTGKATQAINGNLFTTGVLRGNRVVIVLTGVSIVNSAMITQLLLDRFQISHLLMSGIGGGLDPEHHIGDVTIPGSWALPLETYWSHDSDVPAPCGAPGELGCLGLKLAAATATQGSDYDGSGLFMREHFVMNSATAPEGEFKFAFDVDPTMLKVARASKPVLERCGSEESELCVPEQPQVRFGGVGVSGPVFLANPKYRAYVAERLGAVVVDMETAALAHVAYANRVPFIAFRSLSDLAGGGDESASVGAFFGSGLAEANEARVTLAFLEAWSTR